jgi:hypothetical protein
MPTVKIRGRVLPEVFNVSVGFDPTINWKWEETNQELRFSYTIKDSTVEIRCDLDKWQPEYRTEIYKRSYDILRTAVNLVAFAKGWPLYVYLNQFVGPDGQENPLAIMNSELDGLCTAFALGQTLQDKNPSFDSVLRIVLLEPAIFLALSDLCFAMTYHDQIVTGCARGLDGLRVLIWGKNTASRKEAKKSWEKLRSALRVDEGYLKLITESSMGPRHGSREHIPGTVTSEITKRSWVIMNRYLELRVRGGERLPAEYPILAWPGASSSQSRNRALSHAVAAREFGKRSTLRP